MRQAWGAHVDWREGAGGVLGGTYGRPRVQWGRVGPVSSSGLHRLAEGGWIQSGVESRSRLELSPTVAPKGRGGVEITHHHTITLGRGY